MNRNGRIYPAYAFKLHSGDTLDLNYNEDFRVACFDIQNVKTIQNKGHSRAIRRKTGFKEIITGDVFYNKLWWSGAANKTGMAIIRDKKVIWYSMPGPNPERAERKVLIEKVPSKKQIHILKGILQRFETINR